ncbi:zinc finger, C2H2 type [Opisthorchis viverrini]|uniref:Zinc finger, C2H2 type n=1 Tax=Opisthorchis viverrini TaxID=6198 RepID=A0A1S8WR13_OPIVI|nr:zinc finger, C2H2 type [Opisthorchis viverrini]
MEGSTQVADSPEEFALYAATTTGAPESEEFLRCPLCNQSALSRSALVCHLADEHKERLVAVCKICGQYFPSDKIRLHVLRCKGSHICPYCHSTFARLSYLQRHVSRQHSSFTRPICDMCGKSFSSTGALSIHKRTHNGRFRLTTSITAELPHSCKLCGALFSQSCHVKFHLDSHHAYLELSNKPKPFRCDTCGRGFLFACSLQNHRKQHTAQPYRFSCTVCGRKFRFLSELERHHASHLQKPVYSCSFCQQLFRRLSLLKAHMLRHTDPGFLTCYICLRTYASRTYLIEHMEKHRVDGQASSTTSFDSESAPDLDLGALTEDCGITAPDSVLFDEMLLEKCGDPLYHPSTPPNVNLLHEVLYGTASSGDGTVGDCAPPEKDI